MANYVAARRRPTWWATAGLLLAVVIIGGGAAIAGLWATGLVDLPFLRVASGPSHEGKVQVLMSAVPIPAYTRLTRDHLTNPQTKQAASFWLAEEQVPPGVKLELADIVGRVLKHDKGVGYFFTEDDFMPAGTRPGLVAGIPPGKRSVTLEASKITGIAGLRAGDRFDLISSLAIEERNAAPGRLLSVPGYAGAASGKQKHAKLKVVVENGAVVLPIYLRPVPTTTHSLTSGSQSSTKPVQEIVIAVEAAEVPKLTEALAIGAELTAVARSGMPSENQQDAISIAEPEMAIPLPPEKPKTRVIETIVGRKRTQVEVPLASAAPDATTSDREAAPWLQVLGGLLGGSRKSGGAAPASSQN